MKLIKVAVFISFFITVISFSVTGVSACGYSDISEEYEQMLEGIPDDISEYLPDSLFSEDVGGIHEAVKQMSGFGYIIKTLFSILGVQAGGSLRLLAALLGIVVLSSLLKSVRMLFRSSALDSTVSFCTSAALIGALVTVQYKQLTVITGFLDKLNILANSVIPIMGTLYAMGGNVAAAAVNNSAMVMFITVCENLCNRTVIPITVLCLSFALVSAFSPSVDIKGIAGFVKKSYTTILSFTMTLLIALLAAQSTLAAASDGISARTAKFMAGRFIPVIGGSVGDSLKTVAGSIRYIRSSVGIGGIVIIILLLLPPLVSVIMTRLALMLAGTAARLLGCRQEAGLIGEITDIYGYLMAVICACSVLFIFALTLLARTSSAIGA